jgi:uncharacterized protein (TIGR02246 family)
MPATPPAASTASAPATPPKPSMAEMQQSTMKAITDAMNAHDSAKFAASFADDATVTWGGMPDQHGRADIAKVADQFYTAFKDLKFWVSRVWMKGDMVAVEWAGTAPTPATSWAASPRRSRPARWASRSTGSVRTV